MLPAISKLDTVKKIIINCARRTSPRSIREKYSWPHKKLLVSEEKIYVLLNRPFYLEDLSSIPQKFVPDSITALPLKKSNGGIHIFIHRQFLLSQLKIPSIAAEFVSQGLGFTVCPGILIRGREQEFYRLPLTDKNEEFLIRRTWLYYQEKSLENPIVHLFVDFLKTYPKESGSLADPAASQDPKTAYCGITNRINRWKCVKYDNCKASIEKRVLISAAERSI